MSFRTMPFKGIADPSFATPAITSRTTDWRRRADSNRRITDLQSAALPLGYGAVVLSGRRRIASLRDTFQVGASADGLVPRVPLLRGPPWSLDHLISSQQQRL